MSEHPTILELDPPPGARVRVLSDLHFGHERCEAPAVEKLAPLLDGVRTLVIAGDLSETRSCAWQQEGLRLREQLRELCRKRGVTLITLSGNHDPDAGSLLLSLWGGRTVVMHGHALYKEGAPWSWEYLRNRDTCQACIARYPAADHDLTQRLLLSREMCQLTPPILRREGIRNHHLRGLLHCFFPPQRPLRIVWGWLTCGRKAEAFARRFFPEARVVVLGHFHRSGHWQYGGRTIVNTGAWFTHATPWLADLQGGALTDYRPVRLP